MENFKLFLLDVPTEMGLKIINKLHKVVSPKKNLILNNKEFVEKYLAENYKKLIH